MATADNTAPTLVSWTTSISPGGNLVLTFSEAVLAGSGNIVLTDGSSQTYFSGGVLRTRIVGATDTRTIGISDPQVSVSGNTVTINLAADLAPNARYSVQMGAGALKDAAGNAYKGLADSSQLSFATGAAAGAAAYVSGPINMIDSGPLANDYITRATAQVFSGAVSGTLAAGDVVQVSLDNGATWQSAIVSGNSWSHAATISASGTVLARVTSQAGVSTAPQSQAFVLDQAGPAPLSLSMSDTNLTVLETATVTATFNEKVASLTAAAFTVIGGTLGAFSTADGGLTWTATFTPAFGVANGNGGLALRAGSVTDLAGNINLATSDIVTFSYHTVMAPAAVVNSAITIVESGASSTDFLSNVASQVFAGTFSGVLDGNDRVTVSLDGGATWHQATVSGNNWSYAATIAASGQVQARVTNGGGFSSDTRSQAYTFDNSAPAVPTIALSDSALGAGETATVTVTFTEKVFGLEAADFTVSGGTLGAFGSADGGLAWTATLTPTAGASGSGGVALAANTVADLAGNAGPAAASAATAFSYDTKVAPNTPTTVVSSVAMTDTGSSSTDFITKASAQTITGTVSAALAAGEFVQVSLDNGVTWHTATASGTTFSYSGTIGASGTLLARVTNAGAQSSTALSRSYTYDSQAPALASIVLSDTALGNGETAAVTITFSEKVRGLDAADFTVSGGTLSGLGSDDGGLTWTALLTPTASASGAGSIALGAGSVEDVAGNAGPATAPAAASFSYNTRVTLATADTMMSPDTGLDSQPATFEDFVTSSNEVVLQGSYAGQLAASPGARIEVSVNGVNWEPVTTVDGAEGAHGTWTSATLQLSGRGTLHVRLTEADGSVSTQDIDYLVDNTPPASLAAVALDLVAASDSGHSDIDNITSDDTPTVSFDLSQASGLVAGDIIEIIDSSDDNAVVGRHTVTLADLNGDAILVTLDRLSAEAADGDTHVLQLRATDLAGNHGAASAGLGVVVDTTRPSTESQSPAPGGTGVGLQPTISLTLSEAVYLHATHTFSIETGGGVVQEVGVESGGVSQVGGTISIKPAMPLQASTTYTVRLSHGDLADDAGNLAYQSGDLVAHFTTGSVPGALTLSYIDTGSGDDHITANNTFTVTGVTASHWAWSANGGTTWTDMVSANGHTFTLVNGLYAAGQILVRQYDTAGLPSAATGTGHPVTVDTSAPAAYVSGYPYFHGGNYFQTLYGLELSAPLTEGEFIEYTTDYGLTWTRGSVKVETQTDAGIKTSYNLPGVKMASNGAVGIRVSDAAGNIGGNAGLGLTSGYTIYVGDGYGTNYPPFDAAKTPYLYAGGGWDAITANAAVTGKLAGGGGGDTITVTGSVSGWIDGNEDNDTITITGAVSGTIDGGDGDDDIVITGSLGAGGAINGGDGHDDIFINGAVSGQVSGGAGHGYDTLHFSGTGLVIGAAELAHYAHFEQIDLGSGNRATFTAADVLALTDNGNELWVGGDHTSSVDLSSGEWTFSLNQPDQPGWVMYETADRNAEIRAELAIYTNGGAGVQLILASHTPPAAPTLSYNDTAASNDRITADDTFTVGGLTQDQWAYSTDGGEHWTYVATVTSHTFEVPHGVYDDGMIQVRQVSNGGWFSTAIDLGHQVTVDTVAPTGYVSATPAFFGLGSGTVSAIPVTLSHTLDAGEFLEYTTDNGVSWLRGTHASGASWTLENVSVATGKAIGLRLSDTAGNLSAYTQYVGDGYGGTFNAADMPYLDAGGGNDTIALASLPTGLVSGGAGTADTLSLTGSGLYLDGNSLANLSHFERINLGSGNSAELSAYDVAALSDNNKEVWISGSSTSTVYLDTGTWTQSATPSGQAGWVAYENAAEGARLVLYTNEGLGVQVAGPLTLSYTDTANASDAYSRSDHITASTLITIGGLVTQYWDYSTDSGYSWTSMVRAAGNTFTLAEGSYADDAIQVRQYSDAAIPGGPVTLLGHALTIDTSAPLAFNNSVPYFLGRNTPQDPLTGAFYGTPGSGEFVEYTTDNGATWTRGTIAGNTWTLTGVQVATGMAIGLRLSDTAGNIGTSIWTGANPFVSYFGDGYDGTFNADVMSFLSAGDGADTVTTSTVLSNVIGGGAGYDKLKLTGTGLHLNTAALLRLSQFEYIDLGSGNSAQFSAAEVKALSDNDKLLVYGNNTDSLYMGVGVWTLSAAATAAADTGWVVYENTTENVQLLAYTNGGAGVQLIFSA